MKTLIVASVLLISGCAPLQQAPLMYTSKQVFGVDISAPTTESAGVTMNLGFKNVDAAYVPIAVSKDGNNEKIELVSASYGRGESNGEKSDKEQLDRINAFQNALKSEQDVRKTWQENSELLDLAGKYNDRVDQVTKDGLEDGALQEFISNNEPIKRISEIVGLARNRDVIPVHLMEKLKGNVVSAENTLKIKSAELEEAKKSLAELLYVNRRDAMSVYGSFGATTGADTTSISNKLGKMFSTGVAAQNLTEGIANEGKSLAAGQFLSYCIELIKKLEEGSDEQKKFAADCSSAALEGIRRESKP